MTKLLDLVLRAHGGLERWREVQRLDVRLSLTGSGTTLIACEKSGRLARLIDLEPNYCDVIIQRWQQFSGGTARHAVSGQCFDEAAVREPATAFQQAREVSV